MPLEREQLVQIAEGLTGTCKSLGEVLDALEIEADEGVVQNDLLDVNVEICVACDWWHDVSDLEYIEKFGGGLCEQCREEHGIED